MRRLARAIALSLLAGALSGIGNDVFADDVKQAAADSQPQRPQSSADTNVTDKKEKLEFYRRRLRELRLFVDESDKPCQLVEDPLTRWDNPISQNADGMMFLWTDRGRPVAMMNNHFNYPIKTWGRIFVSLSARPLEMRLGHKPLWTPRQPGLTFKPLDNVKPPAETATARLVQLRNIAKEFQVDCHWGGRNKGDWRLRLLTTPLYRYQVPDEGVVDGALFAFIQAGPEAVLLLEARKTSTDLEWHYAANRCTNYYVRFSRNDTTVFESQHFDQWTNADTFFGIRVPMNDYPFGDPFANTKTRDSNNPMLPK